PELERIEAIDAAIRIARRDGRVARQRGRLRVDGDDLPRAFEIAARVAHADPVPDQIRRNVGRAIRDERRAAAAALRGAGAERRKLARLRAARRMTVVV